MIYAGSRKPQPLAPFLKRVLLLDASLAATRMTAEVLKDMGAASVLTETSDAAAMTLCGQFDPQVIITELSGPTLDGLKFVRVLRRSKLACRARPVIVITAEPTASSIAAARNSGVHEFLCKPFTIRDLTRRLEAVSLHRRDWIEAINYIGPDRRRFNSGDYAGPRKRKSDAEDISQAARVEQALRILASAIKSIESDSGQSLRAMQAQADDLQDIAVKTADLTLLNGAAQLKRCLSIAANSGKLSRTEIDNAAAELLARLPAEPMAAFELA